MPPAPPQGPGLDASHSTGRCANRLLAGVGRVADAVAPGTAAPPAGLWLPVGSGATAATVAERVLGAGWSTAVFGVGITGGNSAVTTWPGTHRPVPGGPESVPATLAVREPGWSLVRDVAEHGAAATEMLRGTGGAAVGVAPADLVGARELLARHRLWVSASGGAGLAGLLAEAARGRPVTGRPVVVVTG